MEEEPPDYRSTKDPDSCLSQIKGLVKYIGSHLYQPRANFKSILVLMSAIEKDIENMPGVEEDIKKSLKTRLNSPLRLHELKRGAMKSIPGLCPKPIPLCSTNLEVLGKYKNYRGPRHYIDLKHNI